MNQITGAEMNTASVGYLDHRYLDWSAVIGGSVVATAIFTTLTIFGAAIGLSMTSTEPGQGIPAVPVTIAIALWTAWIVASSFAAGGYTVGRLRHRLEDATEHEIRIRDGVHGLLAWSLAIIISGLILISSLGNLTKSAANETARTAQNYQLASLFRGEASPIDQAVRQDAESILKTITTRKSLDQQDEAFLARLINAKTGISPPEATARVANVEQTIHRSLEQTRRAAVLGGFLTAATLAIGAAATWGAAIAGGKHRDEKYLLSPFTKWS
jgi:hypothetical protein